MTFAGAGSAQAFSIKQFSANPASTQAGAFTDFTINLDTQGTAAESLSSVDIDFPAGLMLGPDAVDAKCKVLELVLGRCPAASRVGTIGLYVDLPGGRRAQIDGSVFVLEPLPGDTGDLALAFPGNPAAVMSLRVGKGGTIRGSVQIMSGSLMRVVVGGTTLRSTAIRGATMTLFKQAPSGYPFVSNPTSLDDAITAVSVRPGSGQTVTAKVKFSLHRPETSAGGVSMAYSVGNTQASADTPFALTVGPPVTPPPVAGYKSGRGWVVGNGGDGRAPDYKAFEIGLPPGAGATLSNGRVACSTTDLNRDSCPAASSIGTARADNTPFASALTGQIFLLDKLANPQPLAIVLRGPRGMILTYTGHSNLGGNVLGALVALDEIPQYPIGSLQLMLTNLLIANPEECRSYGLGGPLRLWSGEQQKLATTFAPTGCPAPPQITAGPGNGSFVASGDATFEFRRSSVGAGAVEETRFQCQLDDGPFEDCDSPARYSGLPDGVHTFKMKDSVIQNIRRVYSSSVSTTWTVDTTLPSIELIGASDIVTTNSFFDVFADVTEINLDRVECSAYDLADLDGDGVPERSKRPGKAVFVQVPMDGLAHIDCSFTDMPAGTYELEILAVDAAGNRVGRVAHTATVIPT